MQSSRDIYPTKIATAIKYFSLLIAGLLIILLCNSVQHVAPPVAGEDHYTSFLLHNFTLLAKTLFVIAGFLAGYFYKFNPWHIGICLFLIFPITSIIEATVYRGSHNLIPFEFAIHFVFALPSIAAAYLGRFIHNRLAKQKPKVTDMADDGSATSRL